MMHYNYNKMLKSLSYFLDKYEIFMLSKCTAFKLLPQATTSE